LPIIDGVSPQSATGYQGKILCCESHDDLRVLACDVTPAYRGAARRAVRHLVMIGEEGLISLDDIVPTQPGALIRMQYQTGGETSLIAGGGVLVAGRKIRMRMDVLSPADHRMTLLPERTLHDTHWGYHCSDCRLFPVLADCVVQDDNPIVTVYLDASDDVPGAPGLARQGRELVVTLPSGRAIVFVYVNGVWELEARVY